MINAVDRELPKIEHRMCARHIYGNLKKLFPNSSEMKGLFWSVAESCILSEYEANLDRVKAYDIRLFEAIMQRNPANCSLAFCTPTASCIDVHNNISESFNNAIDPSRYYPMVEMLEIIRRRAMQRIEARKKKAEDHKGRFTKRATAFIAEEQTKLKFTKYVSGSSDGRCEVLDCGKSVSLHMGMRTCACRKWEMSGLPCRHALRIINKKKLNYEDYTSEWYSNAKQNHIYSSSIEPVNGLRFWKNSGSVIKPPPALVEEIQNTKGRKPKPKRKKARHESPTKKASRKKRIMHCGRCGEAGHNVTKCKNPVSEKNKSKKKTPIDDGLDSLTQTQTTQDQVKHFFSSSFCFIYNISDFCFCFHEGVIILWDLEDAAM